MKKKKKKKTNKFIDELCQRMCSYIPTMLPTKNALDLAFYLERLFWEGEQKCSYIVYCM